VSSFADLPTISRTFTLHYNSAQCQTPYSITAEAASVDELIVHHNI
jgi:hypothetical protein